MHSQELIQQLHTNIQRCITAEQARADFYRALKSQIGDDGVAIVQVDLRTGFPPHTKYETRSIPENAVITEVRRVLRHENYLTPRLFIRVIFEVQEAVSERWICYARVIYDTNYQFDKVEYFH